MVRQPRDKDPVGAQLYELNDQLGNTRVVFQAPRQNVSTLTMEADRTNWERQNFPTPDAATYDQVRSSAYARQASPYGKGYAMRLANQVGPGKKLALAPGDRALLEVWAGYPASGGGVITGVMSPPVLVPQIGRAVPPLSPAENGAARPLPAWQRLLGQGSLGGTSPLAARPAPTAARFTTKY